MRSAILGLYVRLLQDRDHCIDYPVSGVVHDRLHVRNRNDSDARHESLLPFQGQVEPELD